MMHESKLKSMALIVSLLITCFMLQPVVGTGKEQVPQKTVAVVKTKAKKEYTFIGYGFKIRECHRDQVKVTEGVFYHYEQGGRLY